MKQRRRINRDRLMLWLAFAFYVVMDLLTTLIRVHEKPPEPPLELALSML